jgi:hypothetical protein
MHLGALAPGDVFFLYDDSSSRRSTHIVQRSRDPIPSIITSSADNGSPSTQEVPTPILSVYPPSVNGQESADDASSTKELEEIDLGDQDISGSSLDPSSIPLRVVYSPAVSRSGSVSQTDRPSILLSHHDSSDNTQIIRMDSSQSGPRIRSNSFEVRPQQGNTVHRRNLSRNNSAGSTTDEAVSPTENTLPTRQSIALGSSNRRRRLTIEEVAEESDENGTDITVFKAFPDRRWWNSVAVAKVALGIVTAAVLGNLIYT